MKIILIQNNWNILFTGRIKFYYLIKNLFSITLIKAADSRVPAQQAGTAGHYMASVVCSRYPASGLIIFSKMITG